MNLIYVCLVVISVTYVQAECPSMESLIAIGAECKAEHKHMGCVAKCFLDKIEMTTPDGQLDKSKVDPFVAKCKEMAAEHDVDLPKLAACVSRKRVDTTRPNCAGYLFMLACFM